ncbi:MAG: DUF4157 domain-containing protein [Anaerolineales bacterium]|nr:MAG: DUF4157 domain-containing protein [Anaerolineales bacterium]
MSKELTSDERQQVNHPKRLDKAPEKQRPAGLAPSFASVLRLQRLVGNQAVQRLLQRQAGGQGFDLDDETAGRINQARGGGQALDSTVQKQMGASMGHDFSNVRVHDSPESDTLNQQLSAKAFTTGQDIFFRQGAYDPGSSGGQELIAHELSHVVQQGTGRVSGSGSSMTVRPAGDAFEQEADALSKAAPGTAAQVQRQAEEEEVQMQAEEEEEPIQTKALSPAAGLAQRQEDEEEVQMQAEEEEEVQMQAEEEEEVQMQALQRQDEIPEEEF